MIINKNTRRRIRPIRCYYNLRQTPEMSCQEYFERVQNTVDVIKSLGGMLCDDMHLNDELPARPATGYTQDQYRWARKKILDKTTVNGILVRADRERFGKLIERLKTHFWKEIITILQTRQRHIIFWPITKIITTIKDNISREDKIRWHLLLMERDWRQEMNIHTKSALNVERWDIIRVTVQK